MPTALITGTSRGIGLELTRQYLAAGYEVIACARNLSSANALQELKNQYDSLDAVELDIADFSQIDQLAKNLNGRPIDILINNAGVFGPKIMAEKDPRQTLGFIDYELWAEILKTNTMAPLKMAEAFYENLQQSEQKKIINMSSRAASFSEGEGELFMYKTSKTALNMITKVLGDKTKQKHSEVIAVAFSPGWVKTDMGGSQADIEVEESVSGLIKTISGLTTEDSGSFLNYDGESLSW